MNKTKRAQEEEYTRQSLQKFFAKYPNEDACLREFPANCKACGTYNEKAFESSQRVFDCDNCSTKTWRTAGTIFHGLKYLLPTFALIWTHEDRAILSPYKLSQIFKIAYSTAWETDKKLHNLFEREMENFDTADMVTTAFNPVICKRSNFCTGGEHPDYFEENVQIDPDILDDLDEDQQAVCAALIVKPTGFDVLFEKAGIPIARFSAALGTLNLLGIVKQHLGNKYSLKKNPTVLSRSEKSLLEVFFEYIRNFHGISRKYLQQYVAAFWARYCRKRWSKSSLLECCMTNAINGSQRVRCIHPGIVQIPFV